MQSQFGSLGERSLSTWSSTVSFQEAPGSPQEAPRSPQEAPGGPQEGFLVIESGFLWSSCSFFREDGRPPAASDGPAGCASFMERKEGGVRKERKESRQVRMQDGPVGGREAAARPRASCQKCYYF